MPPRISRVSAPRKEAGPPKSKVRAPRKSAKRAHDAFSIASHEHGDKLKIAKHRLGESDVTSHRQKRGREEAEDEEDEDEEPKRRRRGDDSMDEGSDSEGNTWTMGHVEDDSEDSDIDSDEAFGESDEERFEGWVFRGSSSNAMKKSGPGKQGKSKKRAQEGSDGDEDMMESFDLFEDEGDSADAEDEDDLGEDAIDLATALDQYEESDEDEDSEDSNRKKNSAFDDSEPSEEEDIGADGASDLTSDEEDEDVEKIARLQDLISSLPEDRDQSRGSRRPEVHESGAPSEFGVMRKVDLASFKSKSADPEKKKSLKLLQDDPKISKRNDIAKKLDAPLPKRQQDKLDRVAANEKAQETLGRWVDTVKQNRRAEHLSFPLVHTDQAGDYMGANQLMPTTTTAPANDLESTIQSILQESGLSNGRDDEDKLQKWEELQTNKLPLEEVAARRAQLRKERELLFREEVRSKRVKKIKSKAYRRVHRKERERMAEREKDALRADGVDVSEDEREYNDRRRAEERMGAKHRESKWAKSVKQTGKAAWDEDARVGVTEMARRNDELRRRIEGKTVRNEDEDGSDFSSEEEEDEDEDEDGDQVLQRQLGRLKQNPFSTDNSKLGNMAFMQKAEAARRARNDEDIERMRKELAGEDSQSEDDDENAARAGRRTFGPVKDIDAPAIQLKQSEFEERQDSEDEGQTEPAGVDEAEVAADVIPTGASNGTKQGLSARASQKGTKKRSASSANPYLMPVQKEKKSKRTEEAPYTAAESTLSVVPQDNASKKAKFKAKSKANESSEEDLPEPQVSAPDADGWQTVTYNQDDSDEGADSDEGIDITNLTRNQALTAQAFAGDNTEASFALEKEAQAASEDEQTTTTTLPGWGSWVGDALPKKASRHRKPVATTTTHKDGVRRDKRKDKALDRVIINEKKVKKNNKYLATRLPHEFETREQYERSLRVPKGREWVTGKTHREGVKPRVIVKQGVIAALDRPMV